MRKLARLTCTTVNDIRITVPEYISCRFCFKPYTMFTMLTVSFLLKVSKGFARVNIVTMVVSLSLHGFCSRCSSVDGQLQSPVKTGY